MKRKSRDIIYSTDVTTSISNGVDKLADAVKVTLGPKGRNVAIEKSHGMPIVTKDGVTVAKEIFIRDPFENLGAQMVKEVAAKTADVAGDGTTTATVLAQSIYKEGLKLVSAGRNPIALKKGMDKAVFEIIKELNNLKRDIKDKNDIEHVATISANNDKEIGRIIADAMDRAGENGAITIKQGSTFDMQIEYVEGMEIASSYISPYFVTDPEKMKAELNDTYILLTDKNIMNIKEILPILERVMSSGKPLLIVSPNIEAEVLKTLIINKMKGNLQVCAIKAPGVGDYGREMMEDIAILTNGKFISTEAGMKLEEIDLSDLGVANRVVVEKEKTTVENEGASAEKIKDRVIQLKARIEEVENEGEKMKIRARIAKLAGGVSVISIGAATETELKEKKDRVDDALQATKAAVEEGIVPGGGTAYLKVINKIKINSSDADETEKEDIEAGAQIILKAIKSPIKTILHNAGIDDSDIISKILESENPSMGYNVLSGKIEDLFEAGVIDPLKVTRTALQNASSIAAMLLTTECMIVDSTEDEDPRMMNM